MKAPYDPGGVECVSLYVDNHIRVQVQHKMASTRGQSHLNVTPCSPPNHIERQKEKKKEGNISGFAAAHTELGVPSGDATIVPQKKEPQKRGGITRTKRPSTYTTYNRDFVDSSVETGNLKISGVKPETPREYKEGPCGPVPLGRPQRYFFILLPAFI